LCLFHRHECPDFWHRHRLLVQHHSCNREIPSPYLCPWPSSMGCEWRKQASTDTRHLRSHHWHSKIHHPNRK
jgi:hypothetical protein